MKFNCCHFISTITFTLMLTGFTRPVSASLIKYEVNGSIIYTGPRNLDNYLYVIEDYSGFAYVKASGYIIFEEDAKDIEAPVDDFYYTTYKFNIIDFELTIESGEVNNEYLCFYGTGGSLYNDGVRDYLSLSGSGNWNKLEIQFRSWYTEGWTFTQFYDQLPILPESGTVSGLGDFNDGTSHYCWLHPSGQYCSWLYLNRVAVPEPSLLLLGFVSVAGVIGAGFRKSKAVRRASKDCETMGH